MYYRLIHFLLSIQLADIMKYFNETEPINRALEWKREALSILSQTRSNATIAIIFAGITRRT